MGIYLNCGKEAYEEALNSDIFVDKSEMILYLNSLVKTNQKYVCVSRPRRFGKTMAANMISAYYDREADSRSMFENLKVATAEQKEGRKPWDTYLGCFDVIRLVMTDFVGSGLTLKESLDKMTVRVLDDLDEKYTGVKYDPTDFSYSLEKFSKKSGQQFVFVIDEWDSVFREYRENKDGQKEYLDFLRNLFKDKSYVALVYMTGILPIKKYGKHSALNMFTEYSMMFPRQMARFTGFTEEDVKKECDRFGRDFEKIRAWYDGYEVRGAIKADQDCRELYKNGKTPEEERYSLYSPLSVVEAIRTGIIRNYWNKTETYEALAEYIRMDYDGLKESVATLMDGGDVLIDTSTYQNDMTTFTCRDDILSLLIHLGYLGYRPRANEDGSISQSGDVFIPNREILDEFKTSTKSNEWTATFKAFELSQKLLRQPDPRRYQL